MLLWSGVEGADVAGTRGEVIASVPTWISRAFYGVAAVVGSALPLDVTLSTYDDDDPVLMAPQSS